MPVFEHIFANLGLHVNLDVAEQTLLTSVLQHQVLGRNKMLLGTDERFFRILPKTVSIYLKRTYKERFEMATRLFKVQQTMNKVAIIHKPFISNNLWRS